MNPHRQRLLLVLAGAGLGAALLLGLLAPSLISALPTHVRGRLPDEVLRAITTPLPTALPPPLSAARATPFSVAELLPSVTAVPLTATPQPTASPTPSPEPAIVVDQTAVAQLASQTDLAPPTLTPTPPSTATPSPTATPSSTATPTAGAPVLPERVLITGLTVTPQKFNNCGSANMSVMLDYYGLPITQTDISSAIKPHYEDRNVTPEELVAYVNANTDLEAVVFRNGEIDTLRLLLQAGFPVIVEKGYEPDSWQGWMGHYLTLIGYDDEEEAFVSLDTYLGPWDSSGRPISYEELAFRWAQFNHTFLLVYRPFEAPEIAQLLGPDFLEAERMWRKAAAAAETAVQERPEDAFAWFNLGMSLTRLADVTGERALYGAAASAFDDARLVGLPPRMLWYQFEPYPAYIYSGRVDEALALASAVMENQGGWHIEESHFYQGLAYQEAGQPDPARAAFKRALDINPGFAAAQEMLERSY